MHLLRYALLALIVGTVAADASGGTPLHVVLHAKGDPAPGTGGASFTTFGSPAINASGSVAFLGKYRGASSSGSGIFVDSTLVAKVHGPVPGLPGVTFKAFKDPVISAEGRVAFVATLAGNGVTKANDTAILTNGLDAAGTLTVVAREGATAPGADGATWRVFESISLIGDVSPGSRGLLFTAALTSATGSPSVTVSTDEGAWIRSESLGSSPVLAVREGQPVANLPGETVKSFTLFRTVATSPGQSRGHTSADSALMRVILGSERIGIGSFSPAGGFTVTAATLDPFPSTQVPGARWDKVFAPSQNAAGQIAVSAYIYPGYGGVLNANATGIFLSNTGAIEWEPIVRSAAPAPGLPGVRFASFKDVVLAEDSDAVAFPAILKGTGVSVASDTSLWTQPAGGALALLAREGNQAAEVPSGAVWKSFTSLALPGGNTGPLFTAVLAQGSGGVTSSNDTGLWGVDTTGTLRLLFREGSPVAGKTLKGFSVLRAIAGSQGVARSFNSSAEVTWLATFTNGATAIVKTQIP